MVKNIYNLILCIGLIISCSSDHDTPDTFDVLQLQKDLITNVETPINTSFLESIKSLQTSVSLFLSNKSAENLQGVKNSWKLAAQNYSLTEPFNFGAIKETNIHTAFYSWNANETAISDYILSNEPINAERINSLPTNVRGLSAIEFLIFENLSETTLQQFSDSRRSAYLQEIANNLVIKANTYISLWESYRNGFIANTTTGVNGSLNQVINQMYALLEDVKSFKVGQPAGIEKTSEAAPSLLQAEKSSYSLVLIQKNIESIKRIYFGSENGLDDYVYAISKKEELNKAIKEEFDAIENQIDNFANVPLKESIFNNKEEVQKLYNSIRNLLILVKVDVANVLSVTITVTDNDGD